ncbi:hypothetical protein [Solimonas sp. SE-A11]|uniref:hypothetical protein n=1 Tax=Solimonas sp. SE-A11 TaxID=3054954 RepID=UPI00259D1C6D|nr:hypothetical protein [Solimonas sp. SE-A11]MDM4772404.1 hypothetical protein [Solimonas sp. SE-A11]
MISVARGQPRGIINEVRCLDVRVLSKGGWLVPGVLSTWSWSGTPKVSMLISATTDHVKVDSIPGDKSRAVQQVIDLDRTACHLGGHRPWFICPSFWCRRRTAKLYLGDSFRCRRCLRLAYPSTRENATYRALRRVQKVRARLGGSRSLAEPFPPKPRWMRWETYFRLQEKAELAAAVYYRGLANYFV